jgi:hypothetical protein
MGAIFNVFPLILIPVLTYNIWAFGATAANSGDGASVRQHLADAWLRMPMASGAEWTIAFGDVLVLLALILLFIELLKSTSTGSRDLQSRCRCWCSSSPGGIPAHPAFATSVLRHPVMALPTFAGVVVTIIRPGATWSSRANTNSAPGSWDLELGAGRWSAPFSFP